MLVVADLENQIKSALENIVPPAIERCKLAEYQLESDVANKMAKEFSETFSELVCADLAKLIANAIDYYIKNACITGQIITVGSMVTQMAPIVPAPTPVVAGKIPNTLGIS